MSKFECPQCHTDLTQPDSIISWRKEWVGDNGYLDSEGIVIFTETPPNSEPINEGEEAEITCRNCDVFLKIKSKTTIKISIDKNKTKDSE
jgi:hypothetical protein